MRRDARKFHLAEISRLDAMLLDYPRGHRSIANCTFNTETKKMVRRISFYLVYLRISINYEQKWEKNTNLVWINILPWRKRNGPDCSRKSQKQKTGRKKRGKNRKTRNAPSSSLEVSISSGITNQ
jgi:hypothetical protein